MVVIMEKFWFSMMIIVVGLVRECFFVDVIYVIIVRKKEIFILLTKLRFLVFLFIVEFILVEGIMYVE